MAHGRRLDRTMPEHFAVHLEGRELRRGGCHYRRSQINPNSGDLAAVVGVRALDATVGLQTDPAGLLVVGGSAGMGKLAADAKLGFLKDSFVFGASAKLFDLKTRAKIEILFICAKVYGDIGLGAAALGGSVGMDASVELELGLTLKLGIQLYAK